jgi:hypothetical protein
MAKESVEHVLSKKYEIIFCGDFNPGRGMCILIPARESLVSDIPAGEGNLLNRFLQCIGSGLQRGTLFCFVYSVTVLYSLQLFLGSVIRNKMVDSWPELQM